MTTGLDPLEPTTSTTACGRPRPLSAEAGRLVADYFARRELLSIDRKGAQDLVSEGGSCVRRPSSALPIWAVPGDGFLGEERAAVVRFGLRLIACRSNLLRDSREFGFGEAAGGNEPVPKSWQRPEHRCSPPPRKTKLPARPQHGFTDWRQEPSGAQNSSLIKARGPMTTPSPSSAAWIAK